MATFVPGVPVATTESRVDVTVTPANPLPPGRHRFQLVVVDDSGNESDASIADVLVVDNTKPTAVLDAPASVPFGSSFSLSGARSIDLAPGRIVQYRWTRVS